MSNSHGLRSRWIILILLVALTFAASSMTASADKHHGGDHKDGNGPLSMERGKTKRLKTAPNAPAQITTQAVACAPMSLDMKLLVLTPPGDNPELGAIQSTLDFLGAPYDVRVVGQSPLAAAELADSCHAHYQAVLLTNGDLAYESPQGWASALTTDEWTALWTFEATFGIRQVSWYTYPTANYGFQAPSAAVDTGASGMNVAFTQAGKAAFPYVNTANPLTINYAYAYTAKPLDSNTTPWLTDTAGNALAAVRAYPDGRQNLALTFDSNQYLTHNTVLGQGIISWATKGVFLGERHVYISAQVDDVLIDDSVWTPDMVCGANPELSSTTYRVTTDDMRALKQWQNRVQRQNTTGGLVLDMAFNGYGATPDAYDDPSLTRWVQNNQGVFKWISHTWDHELLDAVDYNFAYAELKQNIDIANAKPRNRKNDQGGPGGLGLNAFSKANLVTPEISGLHNAAFLQAAHDLGVRYVVSDSSKEYNNPSPNAGVYNPLQPDILMIPRHPNNLFYNVSTPDQWVAEYNCFYGPSAAKPFWDHNLSYNEILDKESTVLLGYMLKGDNDPWMFHQTNLRAYDGTHSLLGDLLDRTLAKYNALYKLPVVSPTMDQLGQVIANRMAYNTAGVTASITPGVSMTLTAQQAVVIPVTGVRTNNSENYGGQKISYIKLQAGQSVTIPLN